MEHNNDKPRRKQVVDMSLMNYGKVPPQAKELEQAVLGAILLERKAFDVANELLKPESFYVDANQKIFQAMVNLNEKHQPIDFLTVVQELIRMGFLDHAGGPHYVTTLTNSVVSGANVEAHARIVLQKFLQREVIRISGEILSMAYEDTTDVFDLLDFAEEGMTAIRLNNMQTNFTTLQAVLVTNLKKIEELRMRDEAVTGVPSGFPDLDKVTSGWQDTDLIILAARPSVGKSALALKLGKEAAKDFYRKYQADKTKPQKGVGIFSLEMANAQSANRMLSDESEVFMWRLQNGRLGESELRQLYRSTEDLSNLKIFMDDTSAIKMGEFKSKARRMVAKHNVGLIIFDYLQLGEDPTKKIREQEIAAISRALKGIAKELKIPVIALSQMSREFAKQGTGTREPQLSDLRESGAIEQDADMVIFLWKPTDAQIAEDAVLNDIFYAKIDKHRNGTSNVRFLGKFIKETQTHEYLKLVDASLNPIGGQWTPQVAKDSAAEDAKLYIQNGATAPEEKDDMPF